MTQVDAQLGIGVHPYDPSVPMNQPYNHEAPVNETPPMSTQPGRRAYDTRNSDALPVFERSSEKWSANTLVLNNAEPLQVAGKQKGRKELILFVPNSATAGVVIAPDSGEVSMGGGVQLDPGATLTLKTEAAVWAGLISGQTTGTICVVATSNPPEKD